MLPMEFDHHMLNSLPLPSEQGTKKVFSIFHDIMTQRVLPYFRNRRGTDLIQLAHIKQNTTIQRLEDEENRIPLVGLLTQNVQGRWTIKIHERIFDYIAFVTPLKAELSIANGNIEERKMTVFAEFFLRHQFEHILYPDRKELDIIRSDMDFAMEWYKEDPTSYRMLRTILSDPMNGLRGKGYLELFDKAEEGKPCDCAIGRMLTQYISTLGSLPLSAMEDVFPLLDFHVQSKILGECYRTSRSTAFPLVKRSDSLKKVTQLFAILIRRDREKAATVFQNFKDRWGLMTLFHELDLPQAEDLMEDQDVDELFELFSKHISTHVDQGARRAPSIQPPPAAVAPQLPASPPPEPKSLKDRIEEARQDPYVPRSVMELIDKNKQNAAGQSGAKYSELIETLLAIPWGGIRKIWISPEEFEDGLNRSHFGLQKPKEIVCDFFANLIWRYRHFREEERRSWHHTGSALLFVGPPGVGKTSLAISIARNLGIPYHKISLGGMRDEADIRGYGFTYEGSKPGPIVQGLVKMGAMNGMFILDEADKTEKFAIATLLEILDPEQNHLFHDKYTQSTIDIDLSNSHFILTANTLETVPPAVLSRCEVIFLDRYSVEEKIAIARQHLVQRVRDKYMIGAEEIFFDADEESDLMRHLIRNYTFEAGVRDLERIIRTLFLRIQRKEIMARGRQFVRITKDKIREYLDEPNRPRQINEDDRVGEMMGLGVNMENGVGSLIPIQVTKVKAGGDRTEGHRGYMSMVHATGNIEKVMDESRKVAATAIVYRAKELGIVQDNIEDSVHLHFMGGSTKKDGPSAGGAIALALASLFLDRKIRRDVAMTGEIDTQGRITGIGGLGLKLETAYAAGTKTMIIPRENMRGNDGIDRLPEALKQELQILNYETWKSAHEPFDYTRHMLQVVAVDNILQAVDIALINPKDMEALDEAFVKHGLLAQKDILGDRVLPTRCLRVIHVNDPDDLDPALFQPGVCEVDFGPIFLVDKGMKAVIQSKLPDLVDRVKFRDFNPARENLTKVIQEIRASLSATLSPPLRISVIAPLYFLKRDGIRTKDFPADSSFEGLRLLASSCTVENVQIKDCKTVLSRAYHHLSRLEPATLEECPFLVKKDDIYTYTLSFIPEKYRLDVQRSEEILQKGVGQWLDLVEGPREPSSDEAAEKPGLAMVR